MTTSVETQTIFPVLTESPEDDALAENSPEEGTENTDPSPPPRAEPPASQLMELTSKIQTLLQDPHLNSKPSELRQLSDTLQRMVETFAPPTPTTDSTVRGRPAGAVFRNAANGARLKSKERTKLGVFVLADLAVMDANGW
eukprot:symbB.v1.2.015727.t1/scaffold1184.1/size176679/7